MLPSFSKSRKKLIAIRNSEIFNGMYSVSPVLSQIPTRPQREGERGSFQDEQGAIRQINYEKSSVCVKIPLEEARGMTFAAFVEKAREPGVEMGKMMMQRLYSTLEETTKETGNIVNGPLNYDTVLELLEKVQLDFGNDGNPIWPSWHLGAEAHERFKSQLPVWLKDPVFLERLKQVVERQREKFYEREACRRLVD